MIMGETPEQYQERQQFVGVLCDAWVAENDTIPLELRDPVSTLLRARVDAIDEAAAAQLVSYHKLFIERDNGFRSHEETERLAAIHAASSFFLDHFSRETRPPTPDDLPLVAQVYQLESAMVEGLEPDKAVSAFNILKAAALQAEVINRDTRPPRAYAC